MKSLMPKDMSNGLHIAHLTWDAVGSKGMTCIRMTNESHCEVCDGECFTSGIEKCEYSPPIPSRNLFQMIDCSDSRM